jgi:hypothetical protein
VLFEFSIEIDPFLMRFGGLFEELYFWLDHVIEALLE